MSDSANKHILFVLLACLVMGFVLSRQFFWHKEVKRVTQPNVEEDLALQVNRLYNNTQNLRKESVKLQEQYNAMRKAADDTETAKTSLNKSINELEIVTGQTAVSGPGVIIQFSDGLEYLQITDLVNAARNIGSEAISINDKRITMYSSWDDKTFTGPVTVKVIGDKDLLKDALERTGGILELIGSGSVVKVDMINIPGA